MYNSPWAHHYYRRGWIRGGGHRLVWFLLGAGAATWYLHHRDRRGPWGHHDHSYRWRRLRGEDEPLPVENGSLPPSGGAAYDWKEEIDRVKQIGHQASVKVAEMGDAGLESALSAVATLRLKLREAEERARVAQEQARATPPPTAPADQSYSTQNTTRRDSTNWPS